MPPGCICWIFGCLILATASLSCTDGSFGTAWTGSTNDGVDASLTISSVSPNLGNALGGATLALSGQGFSSSMSIAVGGAACTELTVTSTSQATCVLPALTVGQKDIEISVGSSSSRLSSGYTVGSVLALVSNSSNKVVIYSVDSSTGALSLLGSQLSSGTNPRGVLLAKNNRVYVFNSSGSISAYSYSMSSGALTEISGSPTVLPGCSNLKGAALSPNGQFVFASCESSNQLHVYNVQSTGALIVNASGPYAVSAARAISVDRTGANLVVSGYSGGISLFSINSDGSLVAAAGNPFALAGTLTDVLVEESHVYVPNWTSAAIHQFTLASPILTALTPSTVTSDQTGYAYSFVLNRERTFGYVPHETLAKVAIFSRSAATGLLTYSSTYTAATGNLRNARTDPSGQFLYVVGNNSVIQGYSVNSLTGALTELASSPVSLGADANVYRIDIQ